MRNLDSIFFDQEVYKVGWKIKTLTMIIKLVHISRFCRFINIFVFQEHDSNCQIENEERADNDTEQEVDVHKGSRISIFIDICDINPAF